MARIGKPCPACGHFVEKSQGCDVMMASGATRPRDRATAPPLPRPPDCTAQACWRRVFSFESLLQCGTNAHGRIQDALRNGGCGYLFHWESLQAWAQPQRPSVSPSHHLTRLRRDRSTLSRRRGTTPATGSTSTATRSTGSRSRGARGKCCSTRSERAAQRTAEKGRRHPCPPGQRSKYNHRRDVSGDWRERRQRGWAAIHRTAVNERSHSRGTRCGVQLYGTYGVLQLQ